MFHYLKLTFVPSYLFSHVLCDGNADSFNHSVLRAFSIYFYYSDIFLRGNRLELLSACHQMEHLDVGEAVSKRLVKQLRVEHRALYQLQETRDQQNKAYQIESSERLTQSEETQKRLEGQHRMLQHKIENLETMVEDMRKDIQAVRSEEMLVCQEMRARLAELEMSIAKNYTDCVAYLRSAGAPYEEPHGSQELGDNVELLRALDGKYLFVVKDRVSF